MTLAPVVTKSVSQQLTILREIGCSKGSGKLFASLVLGLRVLVPNYNRALAAVGGERVVQRVEGYTIDSVYVGLGLRHLHLLTVALEAKVRILTFVVLIVIIVLDTAAPLN